jgi:hypothetical protein
MVSSYGERGALWIYRGPGDFYFTVCSEFLLPGKHTRFSSPVSHIRAISVLFVLVFSRSNDNFDPGKLDYTTGTLRTNSPVIVFDKGIVHDDAAARHR